MEVGATPKGDSKEPPRLLPSKVQEATEDHGPGRNCCHRVQIPILPSAWSYDELRGVLKAAELLAQEDCQEEQSDDPPRPLQGPHCKEDTGLLQEPQVELSPPSWQVARLKSHRALLWARKEEVGEAADTDLEGAEAASP